jgi:excisionase family DNA binding protein
MVQKRKKQSSRPAMTKSEKSSTTPVLEGPSPLVHPVYTTAQVAAALRLSTRTILRAIVGGHLEARKVGKLYLIAQDAVQRYWQSLPLATEAPKTVGRPKKLSRPAAGAG